MSTNINSKDIINKMKIKYENTEWNDFLNKVFSNTKFEKYISNLIKLVEGKKTFSPAIKNWYDDFIEHPVKKVKVIFVSTNDLPISNKKQYEEQGVMFFKLNRVIANNKNGTQEWNDFFNVDFIEYVIKENPYAIFVLTGTIAEDFSSMLPDNYKIFLPESEEFFKESFMFQDVKNKINILLEKQFNSEINW